MPVGNEVTFQALEKARVKLNTPDSLHSTHKPFNSIHSFCLPCARQNTATGDTVTVTSVCKSFNRIQAVV